MSGEATPPAPPALVAPAPGDRAALLWRFDEPRPALSTAPVGGGWNRLAWVLGIGVAVPYTRTDLDAHAAEAAAAAGLAAAVDGPGAVLLTAADVTRWVGAEDGGVRADATVGITTPTWAADAEGAAGRWRPGTINLVVQVPSALTPAAAVNAVTTAAEAKAQALFDCGIPGTGTASDALVLTWSDGGAAEVFGGPRSAIGACVARAVHAAVCRGIEAHP